MLGWGRGGWAVAQILILIRQDNKNKPTRLTKKTRRSTYLCHHAVIFLESFLILFKPSLLQLDFIFRTLLASFLAFFLYFFSFTIFFLSPSLDFLRSRSTTTSFFQFPL